MKTRFPVFLIILLIAFQAAGKDKTSYSLNELISIGLEKNPSVQAGREDISAKEAAYQASRRFLNPSLSYEKGRAESYNGSESRNTEGFSLNQPIENPFTRHFRIEISKKRWEKSEFQQEYRQREFVFEIKKRFYEILLLKNQLSASQNNEKSIQEIFLLIQKRVRAGEVKELEGLKLQVEILRAQNQAHLIQAKLELAKESLNRFLGSALSAGYLISGDLTYKPITLDEERIIRQAMSSHPLLLQKKTSLEIEETRLDLSKWKWLPGLELSAFNRKELDGTNRGFGISLDIPLWDQKRKEVKEAEHLVLKTSSELASLEIELETHIKEELIHFILAEKILALFHDGLLQQSQESMRISSISYEQGEISLIDYLDSVRTQYSILTDYQKSLFDWNLSKAALEKNIGEELR